MTSLEIVEIAYFSKRRKTPTRLAPEKSGKGLRHFSMKVCEKVQQKGITSYNEVSIGLIDLRSLMLLILYRL